MLAIKFVKLPKVSSNHQKALASAGFAQFTRGMQGKVVYIGGETSPHSLDGNDTNL